MTNDTKLELAAWSKGWPNEKMGILLTDGRMFVGGAYSSTRVKWFTYPEFLDIGASEPYSDLRCLERSLENKMYKDKKVSRKALIRKYEAKKTESSNHKPDVEFLQGCMMQRPWGMIMPGIGDPDGWHFKVAGTYYGSYSGKEKAEIAYENYQNLQYKKVPDFNLRKQIEKNNRWWKIVIAFTLYGVVSLSAVGFLLAKYLGA